MVISERRLAPKILECAGITVHWTKVWGATRRAVRLSSGRYELRNVLYLHGFASSPRGRKVTALTEILAPRQLRVTAPDLNIPSFERLDFRAMAKIALWEMKKRMPAAIAGSSLGSLVALEAAKAAPVAPLLLIAPALGFGKRWLENLPEREFIPVFHHGEEKEVPIHRRFFEEMARVEADREPPAVPVTIVMGGRDESVPFDLVRGVWERWRESGRLDPLSRFVEIPEGDHGLTDHVARIAEEIQRSCELPRKAAGPSRLD